MQLGVELFSLDILHRHRNIIIIISGRNVHTCKLLNTDEDESRGEDNEVRDLSIND